MQVCKGCGEEKPLTSFNKDKSTKNGLKNKCRPCINKADTEYRKQPHVRLIREKARKAYQLRNKKKVKAKNIVANELKQGRLIRGSCEDCGTTDNIEGHHDNYDKPKEVRWLCVEHHNDWHKLNGKGLNGD